MLVYPVLREAMYALQTRVRAASMMQAQERVSRYIQRMGGARRGRAAHAQGKADAG